MKIKKKKDILKEYIGNMMVIKSNKKREKMKINKELQKYITKIS